jgi:hypothetical protein
MSAPTIEDRVADLEADVSSTRLEVERLRGLVGKLEAVLDYLTRLLEGALARRALTDALDAYVPGEAPAVVDADFTVVEEPEAEEPPCPHVSTSEINSQLTDEIIVTCNDCGDEVRRIDGVALRTAKSRRS